MQDKNYRPKILFPLGWEAGQPVPTPEGLNEEINSSQGYTKTGTKNREIKELKPFKDKEDGV